MCDFSRLLRRTNVSSRCAAFIDQAYSVVSLLSAILTVQLVHHLLGTPLYHMPMWPLDRSVFGVRQNEIVLSVFFQLSELGKKTILIRSVKILVAFESAYGNDSMYRPFNRLVWI
jgi:hypothetical protein